MRPQGSTSFNFSGAAGALSALKQPITATGILAIVVSTQGAHVHVYSSDPTAKISLDGQPPIDFAPDGADLSSVSTGAHQLTVSQGNDQYKLDVEVGPI